MDYKELLYFIFFDEFIGSLLVPINSTYVLDTALIFRGTDIKFILAAVSGAFLGGILNYILGRLAINLLAIEYKIKKTSVTVILYIGLLLTPVGFFRTIVVFLCGVVRLPCKHVALIQMIICIFYFFIFVMY